MTLPAPAQRIDSDRLERSTREIVPTAPVKEPSLVHSRSDDAEARLRSVRRRFRTISRRYERSRGRSTVLRFALVVVAVAALGFAVGAAFLILGR